jgi:hypothetical protein
MVAIVSHTPGPWKIRRLIDSFGQPYSTYYLANIDIGPCMIWALPENAEQEANARLIAAAPDLLDACRMLVDGDSPDAISLAYTLAKNAIDKMDGSHE